MVVGGNEGPKDLYLEKHFEDLRKRAQIDDFKINLSTKESYIKILDGMHIKIREAFQKKDQEMEYVMLFRFVHVCTKVATTPSSKAAGVKKFNVKVYQNYANDHMDRLEQLEPILRQRYSELEMKTSLNSAKSSNIYKNMFMETIVEPTPKIIPPVDTIVCGDSENRFMDCGKLFTLFKDKSTIKETLLIIDCRSADEFKQSQLKYPDLIFIPQHRITKGISAAGLQHCISKDSLSKWENREKYNRVLLVDKDSTVDKMRKDPHLHIVILKHILTQWDIKVTYKCLAVLEGGFDEFESRYPLYTTHPKRESSRTNNTTDLLKHFNYPEIPEMVPKKPPEPVKPIIPSINRLVKPKVGFSALKEFNEQEKVKEDGAISPSKENGEVGAKSGDGDQAMETEDSDANLSNDTSIFPDPSITRIDISAPEVEAGDTTLSPEKQIEDQEMEQDKPGDGLLDTQRKIAYINNLRKIKPKTSDVRLPSMSAGNESRMDYDTSSDEEQTVPLKPDGVGSGMKRSLSSPNIAKIKEDDMMSTPIFSRSNKPSFSPRVQTTPSLLLGENPDAVYGRTQLGLTGLKNFANNCYMNSIIQCLSNTAPLVQELTNFSSKKPAVNTSSMTKGQIANVFITALHCIWSGDVRIYSIRELKNLMGNYKDIFKGSNHQDSHEFLIILLEYLHDDLNLPREMTVLTGANEESGERAWGEFRKKNESIIQRLFYGQEQSSVTCTVCKHRSVTFDHFFNLSVPIPDTDRTSLEECIQVYLSGENIIWTCPQCKVDRTAVKKLDITRLPPILIIALKRFSHDVSWLEKKETLVTYPLENLELRHLTLTGSEQRHTTYNLHALSTHTGTLRAGHYRAICQNHLTSKWYLFDDTSIHSISAQEVRNNPEVYILFYHAVK